MTDDSSRGHLLYWATFEILLSIACHCLAYWLYHVSSNEAWARETDPLPERFRLEAERKDRDRGVMREEKLVKRAVPDDPENACYVRDVCKSFKDAKA